MINPKTLVILCGILYNRINEPRSIKVRKKEWTGIWIYEQ